MGTRGKSGIVSPTPTKEGNNAMAGFQRNGRKVTLIGDDGERWIYFDVSDSEAAWACGILMIAGVISFGFALESSLPPPIIPGLLFFLGFVLFVAGIVIRMLPAGNAERATRFERNHQHYR